MSMSRVDNFFKNKYIKNHYEKSDRKRERGERGLGEKRGRRRKKVLEKLYV